MKEKQIKHQSNNHLAGPKKRPKGKQKSKTMHKSKEKKKFDPLDYLNALTSLQNTFSYSTSRKKTHTNRDISSAMTIATPALEKTLSATKMRCKSSHSQYRKKSSRAKQTPIDWKEIITEEDNVQFTEQTAREKVEEPIIPNYHKNQRSQTACAIIIQRAWRNYQTYKMINRYYRYTSTKLLVRQSKVSKNRDQEKTLKIKQNNSRGLDFQGKIKFQQSEDRKHLIQSLKDEDNEEGDYVIQQIKEKQAERWEEVMNLMKGTIRFQSKDQLLESLIRKFEENKRSLEKDLLQINQNQNQRIEKDRIIQKEIIFSDESKASLRVIEKINMSEIISEESLQYDSQNIERVHPQFKIFQCELEAIEEKKMRELSRIKQQIEHGEVTAEKGISYKERICSNYEQKRSKIEKNKKQYLFAVTSLKNSAINYYNCSPLKRTNSELKFSLRRCFSLGNTVVKSLLQDLQIKKKQQNLQLAELGLQSPIQIIGQRMNSQGSKSISEDVSVFDKNNTETMKQYSQKIEEQVEKFLIQQFVEECFVDQKLYRYFKPYVDESYEFKKLTDDNLIQFVQEIMPFFYPSSPQLLERVNQKINPTSIQILKIIRDFDFQIDEYELIIPQECFKKYRAKVEKQYEQKIMKLQKSPEFSKKNLRVVETVYQKQNQKKDRLQKCYCFERDLKIMYMKSVFNCFNEYLIEIKSEKSYVNARSSIGPGQLTLAIKEYNDKYDMLEMKKLFQAVNRKLSETLKLKCIIPTFSSYRELQKFQQQLMLQIKKQLGDNQYKWVNYMDEVLEIWQDVSMSIIESLFFETVTDIITFL